MLLRAGKHACTTLNGIMGALDLIYSKHVLKNGSFRLISGLREQRRSLRWYLRCIKTALTLTA